MLKTLIAAALLLATASGLRAQTPTGSITGRVTDASNLSVPGATVTITSPNLQGTRTAVTSANGDYIFPSLPPGSYTITVELTGFATTKVTRDVGAGQPVQVEVTLRQAALSEVVTVTGRADAFTNTSQASTNIQQELLQALPTARTLLSAVNLSPAAHATGPNNAVTIGGAMSADNLFMLDGVQIQDNIRGTPFSLFIEDAIQETTVSTSGISAEYGRFTGGVVNTITRSGGDTFTGSLRDSMTNPAWSAQTPAGEDRPDTLNHIWEETLGGYILRDRLWFFHAGRWAKNYMTRQTVAVPAFTGNPSTAASPQISYSEGNDQKRFEGKLTASLAPSQLPTCLAATIGLASAGSLYGALSAGLRVRETLLPLLLLPVVAPVLLCGTQAFEAAMSQSSAEGWRWFGLLAIFALIYSCIGLFAFDSLLEDS